MKRLALVLTALALLGPSSSPAASDATAAGHGNGSATYAGVTCNAPVAITFVVRASAAVISDTWGAGTTPAACTPVGGVMVAGSSALSQSGSTYTAQSSYTGTDGAPMTDKVVVTVQSNRLVYSRTVTRSGIVVESASANVPRVA
ncbi:MAG TPA: hypothetical protein VM841_14315 [Actinomycetota bacterium]|nr:hypothetical protein [Actinomycetota bacterium]